MMRLKPLTLGLMLAGSVVAGGAAFTAGLDGVPSEKVMRAGHAVAVESCSGCHIAAQHQEFRPVTGDSVPTFEEIANRSAADAASLREAFERTHLGKDAPRSSSIASTIHISDLETSEVIAYILSQRRVR
jgi:hypothetical protein